MFIDKAATQTLIVFLAFMLGALLSYHRGKMEMGKVVEAQYTKIIELSSKLKKREKDYAREIATIEQKQRDASEHYANTLASIAGEHVDELRKSDARGESYRRLSEARAAELAKIAEQYDRIIVDGINVAKQCRAGIEERDRAISLLVERIQSDIRIINHD